ncbi:hypothetical protein VTH82DRAFT_7001 [Thermothelomyces myriococcoides]
MTSTQSAATHPDASSFPTWSHQDVSFPSQFATNGFEAAQQQQHQQQQQQQPFTDATLPSQAQINEPQQSTASTSRTAGPPYVCGIDGCTRSYPRPGDLEKHRKNHSRPLQCGICGHGVAENKDLHRHYWVHHSVEARELGIPEEKERCPSCDYAGRKDNVKRHRETLNH